MYDNHTSDFDDAGIKWIWRTECEYPRLNRIRASGVPVLRNSVAYARYLHIWKELKLVRRLDEEVYENIR